jgi:PAS domain-containing protein
VDAVLDFDQGLIAITIFSSLAATAGMAFWLRRDGSAQARAGHLPQGPGCTEACIFLFDSLGLIGATSSARSILAVEGAADDWEGLRQALRSRFPDFADAAALAEGERQRFDAIDPFDPAVLLAEQIDGTTRIEVIDNARHPGQDASPAFQQAQNVQLRRMMQAAPYPTWRVDAEGRVVWHNAAYADLFARIRDGAPLRESSLFGQTHGDKPVGSTVRTSLHLRDHNQTLWFDVTMQDFDDTRLFFAMDVSPVVNAETAQRKFVQTLTKTFAQLSIGLAIFDRNSQLALFNPALIDLTALPVDFLSARPSLPTFFDRLRDNRMMPEPKSYATWREQMAAMVTAATDGNFQATWMLPSGATYRITGRPHPDGAVAFLFEDISAEVALTRRFRADLDLAQSVLDRIEEAVVVFGASGSLIKCNRAYRAMWGVDPDAGFAQSTVVDAMRIWHGQAGPSRLWGELRDFVLSREDRVAWSSDLSIGDGRDLTCMIDPVQNGATLIRFRAASDAVARQHSRRPSATA